MYITQYTDIFWPKNRLVKFYPLSTYGGWERLRQ